MSDPEARSDRPRRAGWGRVFLGEGAFWTAALAAGVLVASVARIAILAAHAPESAADAPVAAAFVRGLRFDAAAFGYFVALALIASAGVRLASAGRRGGEALGVALALTVAALIAVVDWHFFDEFGSHADFVALEYLDDPAVTFGMIQAQFATGTIVASLLGVAVFGLLAWGAAARLARRAFGRRFDRRALWARLVVAALLFPVLRGGFGRPIRAQDAPFCADRFTNQLVLNGLFTLERALYESARGRDDAGDYGVAAADALRTARAWVAPHGRFVDDRHPMLRTESVGEKRTLNVVVLVLESFAGRHVGALGGRPSLSPRFDELADEGLLFERFYANGPSTNRSLPALLAGIPCLPTRTALTKSSLGDQPLLSLGTILRDAGYRTAFCTAGAASWENLGGWCRNQGFEHVLDRSAFDAADETSVFGVPDHVLLDRTLEFCTALADGSAFGVVVLTASNHPPFAIPDVLPDELASLPVPRGVDPRRATAFRYADWAVARFVRAARETAWGRETLFVLVGDHGLHFAPQADIDLDRRHVPLLLIGPDSLGLARGRRSTLGSHVDLLPTLLHLLGLEGPHAAWGRDLLEADTGRRFAVLGPHGGHARYGLLTDGHLLVDHLDGAAQRFAVADDGRTLGPELAPEQIPPEHLRVGRAYLQAAHRALLERRAGGKRNRPSR